MKPCLSDNHIGHWAAAPPASDKQTQRHIDCTHNFASADFCPQLLHTAIKLKHTRLTPTCATTMSFRRSRRHRRSDVVIVRASSAYNVSAARNLRRQPSQFFDVSFWDGLDDPGLHDGDVNMLMDRSISFKKATNEDRTKDAFSRRSSRQLKRLDTSWTTRSDSRDERGEDLRYLEEEDVDVPIREISF